ncbi:hypothetical protein BdWA1_002692 [Babesia duncani]|uniref:Uncharacterized protein n=1 Tax=Babesia duncani TaxID=323732 RepID=A0AAD9UNQ6_9APIC|nr:hypothetical protein BdWA1_002692 [Babesia duncani]
MASLFKSLFGGFNNAATGEDFTEAHLGEENNFYYNEKYKRWMMRGEEKLQGEESTPKSDESKPTPAANAIFPPPPSTSTGPRQGTNRNTLTSGDLYTRIPGVEILGDDTKDTKATPSPLAQIPVAPKSHFTPQNSAPSTSRAQDSVYTDLMTNLLEPFEKIEIKTNESSPEQEKTSGESESSGITTSSRQQSETEFQSSV